MRAFGKSDIGRVREMNQDSYFISSPEDKLQLFIVADGMGGYKGGEVASKLAVETSKSYIINNFDTIEHDKESILKLIRSAIEYANLAIFEKSKQVPELENMGTTIDICLVIPNKVFIGHVGDSRVYRKRKEFFRKLTTDHSYVQKLVSDDILLMCSDGLTNMLRDEEIVNIINQNPIEACNRLVSKANENGGLDNITAVIIL